MLITSIVILLVLLFLNYLPVWIIISSNKYNHIQGIVFAFLFIGIWVYKISVEIELQDSKKLELKEAVYKSTNRSRARVKRYYHEIWDYVYMDKNKLKNLEEKKSALSALLLRVLTIDAAILLVMAYRGRKLFRKQKEYYSKNMVKYAIFLALCLLIEIINYQYLAL